MSNTKNKRKHNGTFANGNQFWKHRTKHGRKTAFTPDELLDRFFEYYQWIEDNDIVIKEETIVKQDRVITKTKTGKRPTSKEGFNVFLGKGRQYFQDLKKSQAMKEDTEFVSVVGWIENFIEAEQLAGALSNIFKPNIIARLLKANQH